MRILYFSPRDCWPANTGARIRDYQLALQLSRRCPVRYVGLRRAGSSEPEAGGAIRQTLLLREKDYTPANILRGLIGTQAITILNYTSNRLRRELADILGAERFDSIQVEGVHLVEYLETIRRVSPGSRVVADWHNIESEIMWRYAETASSPLRRLMARRTAPLIERAERKLLRSCDAHTVPSQRDRERLIRLCPGARIEVIPNGVDVDYYTGSRAEGAESGREVLFVGSMDYHANVDAVVWFVGGVWPLVENTNPDLSFRIVGREPAPEVRALAGPNVIVTGTVDDIRPHYAKAAATVVPLRVGGGTRLKILESMAAGVPVVSTRLGAEGLDVSDGDDILLADEPAEIAGALCRLAADSELAGRIRRNGEALVRRLYDWSIPGDRLYAVHRDLQSADAP